MPTDLPGEGGVAPARAGEQRIALKGGGTIGPGDHILIRAEIIKAICIGGRLSFLVRTPTNVGGGSYWDVCYAASVDAVAVEGIERTEPSPA